MDLREYLFRKKIKIVDFAKEIQYGRTYVNEIVTGSKKPGKKFAQAVEKATEGAVTAKELLK